MWWFVSQFYLACYFLSTYGHGSLVTVRRADATFTFSSTPSLTDHIPAGTLSVTAYTMAKSEKKEKKAKAADPDVSVAVDDADMEDAEIVNGEATKVRIIPHLRG
jgi:hypothetical protein